MNKDQKKMLLEKLQHLSAEVNAVHQHVQTSKIRDLNLYLMEPIMNQIHNLKLDVERFVLEEPSKDGLYWAKSARHCAMPDMYHLVLVTGDQVQGILDECAHPIAEGRWKDYMPATIKDPAGIEWVPNL